ncbi:pyruvate dehydrogenase [acetyl-transferring]-phosphatase 1, mitochondrial [Labeo rohita]|uniref:pyruvate dehydrogenase [acetyl-transferring]-phosphatase 1, mitochondrial n=1 Tax=Labeo rohita TaxID=84645 RepID=UPI0021E34189|nr:pyruvate dehydrogenase [acetyl-transferring]-phosphatase 1, mitochondrial [Labeo rohita]XP_050978985.1 pyruvate dehydrogenase [acetyl-transferring]-phosphatase 1, mitochondrial [Labeo rohita]
MSASSVHHFQHQWSLQRWKAAIQGYLTLDTTTALHSRSTICTPGFRNPPVILNPRRKYDAKAKQMSLPQINHVLKANEYSLKPNVFYGSIKGFDSNILPSNSPSEDRRSAATCLQSRGMLFGVFDGHAGSACAQAVSERLFYYIAVSLLPLKTLIEIEEAVETERPVLPVLQWHKHPNDYVSTDAGKLYFNSLRTYWQERIDLHEDDDSDIQTALRNAFKRLDNDISLEAQVDYGVPFAHFTPLRVAQSGCTACVAHVDREDLHVANLGDSRAVLGVQGDDGRWSALTLTNDHNAHNPDEMQRVLSEHPVSEEKTVVKHDRLLGLLIPFRAFGDIKFKWSSELLNHIYEARPELLVGNENAKMLLPNYHTPPYLIADPEIAHHKLRPQDRFLILATDGLWELMHRQTVVQVLGEHLSDIQWKKPVSGLGFTVGQMHRLLKERKSRALSALEDENSATHLIRHALGSDGCGSIEPKRIAKMLSLPQDLARMYRDDITIIVIHFNN